MKAGLTVGLLTLVAVGAFLFVIAGGLDKFREPIVIVLPVGFKGVLCVELREDVENQPGSNIYVADQHGRFVMETSVARSHRRMILAWRVEGDLGIREVPSDQWTPVLTEHDADSNRYFSVYWIGTSAEWAEVARRSAARAFCS